MRDRRPTGELTTPTATPASGFLSRPSVSCRECPNVGLTSRPDSYTEAHVVYTMKQLDIEPLPSAWGDEEVSPN